MREIKFRAWDLIKKEMSTPFYIGSELSMDTISKIFLQYTGLKDRNSKEIYEGDIVRVANMEFFPLDDPFKCEGTSHTLAEIIFYKFGYTLRYVDGRNRPDFQWDYLDMSDSMEVIGNIYENHKRLEER